MCQLLHPRGQSISLRNILSCNGSEHFPWEYPLPSPKSMPMGSAGLANAGECQLLRIRAVLREESGVGPLADASAGDKVLVIYCMVVSVFELSLDTSPMHPSREAHPAGTVPSSTSPQLCWWFWGWQVLSGPTLWASVFLLLLITIPEPGSLPQV